MNKALTEVLTEGVVNGKLTWDDLQAVKAAIDYVANGNPSVASAFACKYSRLVLADVQMLSLDIESIE